MRGRHAMLGLLLVGGLLASLLVFQGEAQRRARVRRQALKQEQPLPSLPTKPLAAVPMNLSARAVRILLGAQDIEPTVWKGSVSISEGRILGALPCRQGDGDAVDAKGNFTLHTRQVAVGKGKQALAENGLVLLVDAPPTGQITVTTERGTFSFRLKEVLREKPLRFLEGQAQVDPVAAPVEIAATEREEDFPAAALAPDGTVCAVYVEHEHVGPPLSPAVTGLMKDFSAYRPKGGGDRLMFTRFDGKEWSQPEPLTDEGLDLWRPAVAVEGTGAVWVVWSQNVNGNWDLFARRYDPKARRWLTPQRLTTDPGADIRVAAVRSASGQVWIAWQGWREGNFDILALPLGEKGAQPLQVGSRTANEWSPSLAADSQGNLFVAFDTYERGNYDVRLWIFEEKAPPKGRVVPVAESPLFEASASVVCDGQDRVWIAWEEREANWGKDMGAVYRLQGKEDPGAPLYQRGATVKVACWREGRLQYPQVDPMASLRPALQDMNSYPRLGMDGRGRVWLAFRHREARRGPAGTYWQSYLMAYEGDRWSPPILVAFSDNLLDNRPSLVGLPTGHLLVAYSSDGRYHRVGTLAVVNNSFWAATVDLGGPAPAPALAAAPPEAPPPEAPAVHPEEEKDIARLRAFRLKHAGRTYQLLRGEFHRHTEISGDGGGDGSLEDMWRYALDAARMDWIGNGDHDNGGGREYSWWLIQKTTDIFHHPPFFVPMFSYERSVPYPNGHRNVMFAQRGIRTLPRGELPGTPEEGSIDTKNLYGYLKQFDGICASHTSATDMGTDWRDNDPLAEPVVEIYQGCRQNYEHLGAPRSATNAKESIGGWQPAGFVWEAFQKGFRMGFQASSDHISTHISYAIALVEEPTRRGILEAFKRRHSYAATDNILLIVTCGENLMGDEFTSKVPPTLTIQAVGTLPIVQVDIVRQVDRDVPRYVYAFQPKQREVKTQWTDKEARPGSLHMYYVRVMQEDGNLAWASPLWVTYRP